jgi:putative heme-binding domain-containing protein
VRTERDLLEAIVYPSASFVRGYEPVVVELEDGRTITGIVTRESRDEVVLAIDPQKTQHIARREISEIHPSHVSLMPQGIDKLLSPQEVLDLVVFLKMGPR